MEEGDSSNVGMKRIKLELNDEIGNLFMPGDEFCIPKDSSKIILGPGLRSVTDKRTNELKTIIVCKAGLLRKAKPNTFFLEMKTRSYQSFKKDDVLGIIKQKSKGEHYSIDVACREQRAQLSKNAFEGATKRYRPDLQVGDCIYGKVMDFPKDYPLELTCVQPSGKACGLGSLNGGHIFHVPVHFVRALRTASPKDNLLQKIGRMVPCETAVGANGLVWIKASNAVLTILVAQLLQTLSKADPEEYGTYLNKFNSTVRTVT